MKQGDLMREVESVIEERIANNEPAAMTWIIHAVMNRHPNIEGSDKDFYTLCGHEHVHTTVRSVLRARHDEEGEIEQERQQSFPGYKRLQLSYTIERGKEQVVVRLEQMTPGEIRGKARELRAMATGAMAHAQELEDYLGERGEQAA